ncbi:hypothetical protein R1sor_005758 [Riccia sorocarpa]|uniref:Cytochrome P450 n=1 Tax=Riccia sorocarpa TaxID=122646 RepID=A0ABD3HNF1_9MARC
MTFFSLVITTLTVLVASILFDWWYFLKLRTKRLPPGPTPWPIVGTIPHLVKHGGSVGKLSQCLEAKYGKILTVWLGKKPMIFVNDPELAYDALVKQGAYFSNRVKLSSFRDVTCGWRVLSTGEGPWTIALRKNMMTHMLGPARLKAFKPLRDRAYEAIVNEVKSLAAAAEDGEIIELGMERFLLVFKFSLGDYVSFWRVFEVKYRQELKLNQTRLEELFAPIMERLRRSQGARDEGVIGGNYCETLFQLAKEFPDLKNDSVITSLCAEFLNGAVHTTSLTIDITVALLCEHPEVNEKLYGEIEAVVGKRAVDESDLPQLPYLSAVVKESLRVKSPGPATFSHATSELRKLGGYDIPTDAMVLFGLESFHYDPTYWPEPSVFNPERFLENDLDVLGTQTFNFLPFSVGRRACPGSQLAMLEISAAVARLVQTFEWQKVPNAKNTGIGTDFRARPRSV